MGNASLSFPNRFALPALSGPAFSPTLPLTHLQYEQQSQFARAVNQDKRNTWMYVDPGRAVKGSVFVAANHNLGVTGQMRLRAFSTNPLPIWMAALVRDALPSDTPVGGTYAAGTTSTVFGSDGLLRLTNPYGTSIRFQRELLTGARQGLLVESAGTTTNRMLWTRLGSNAAWSKTNMTAAATATGIDGVVNSATRLTATSANGTIVQAFNGGILSTDYRVFSVYLRRVSGVGAVSISKDNFVTSQVVTLTADWQRFYVGGVGAASNSGIRLATSGDVIEADFMQGQVTQNPTTPILTTTTTTGLSNDTYSTGALAGLFLSTGSMLLRVRALYFNGGTTVAIFGTAANGITVSITSAGVVQVLVNVSSVAQATLSGPTLVNPGDTFTVAVSWAVNNVRASFNGGAVVQDLSATTPAGTATFSFQTSVNSGASIAAEEVRLYAQTFADADLVALSGAGMEITASWDSGLVDAWPAAWVANTTDEQKSGVRGNTKMSLSPEQEEQWWRYDMLDESNPEPLQVGRLFLSSQGGPEFNVIFGAGMGMEPRDVIKETDSGAEYSRRRQSPRTFRIRYDCLSEAEAMDFAYELMRQVGTSGEVLFEWDTADSQYRPQRMYVARLRVLGDLETPFFDVFTVGFEGKEKL